MKLTENHLITRVSIAQFYLLIHLNSWEVSLNDIIQLIVWFLNNLLKQKHSKLATH